MTDENEFLGALPMSERIRRAAACAVSKGDFQYIARLAALLESSPDTVATVWLIYDSVHTGIKRIGISLSHAPGVMLVGHMDLARNEPSIEDAVWSRIETAEGDAKTGLEVATDTIRDITAATMIGYVATWLQATQNLKHRHITFYMQEPKQQREKQ